jgi:hypothetical protein
MSDENRFEHVARSLAKELHVYGLKPLTFRARKVTDTDGWWAKVARWPGRSHLAISVWLDRSLGRINRVFWFGFQSQYRDVVATLAKEVVINFAEPVVIGTSDWIDGDDGTWRLTPSIMAKVSKHKLAHEAYDEWDEYYLGANEDRFGKLGSDANLVSAATKFIGEIAETVDPLLAERHDLEEIMRDVPDKSEREVLIMARRGQGKFRNDLFDQWGGCAVTGCKVPEVLRASHIKPWKRCAGKEDRLDPHNGLLLSATLDALWRGLQPFGVVANSRDGPGGNICSAAKNRVFDHVVGDGEQCRGHIHTECLGGLCIESKLLPHLTKSGGLRSTGEASRRCAEPVALAGLWVAQPIRPRRPLSSSRA